MALTYSLISSNTLTTSAVSVTFSDIPQRYNDLLIKMSARSSGTNTLNIRISFNSTESGYSSTSLYGTGSGSGTQTLTGGTFFNPYGVQPNSYPVNSFASAELYIPSYTVSQNKPIGLFAVTDNNNIVSYMMAFSGLWSNTSAINNITISDPNSFSSNSSFYLYGIKNS